MADTKALDALIEAVDAGTIAPSDLDAFIPSLGLNTQGNDAHSAYRGDLNAAEALHEALLPGWGCVDLLVRNRRFTCYISRSVDKADFSGVSVSSLSRAWLLAVLKAYRASL